MSGKKFAVQAVAVVAGMILWSSSIVLAEMCTAHCNCDGQVNLTDLVKMKQEYFRNDCDPVCISGVTGGVPKTGQSLCYDSTGAIRDCAGTGEDGEYQTGAVPPGPRFTDKGDGTVTDNVTGLIWLKNASCFGSRIWDQALADANGLASGACGLTDGSSAGDWRLPNIKELQSLIDFSADLPALPSGHPFTSVLITNYWSSTSRTNGANRAWILYMYTGDVSHNAKANTYCVWPVRGGND